MTKQSQAESRTDQRKAAGFDVRSYDEIPPGYYDKVLERSAGIQWFWHSLRYAAVVANLPTGAKSVLDLGCGPGTFLGNYAAGFEHRVGVDLAEPQIAYARSKYKDDGLRFEAMDAVGFVGNETFDVVISIEVIEHLPPDETLAFLRTIYDLLSPGGVTILATPNYASLWPIIEWFVSRIGPVNYRKQHINQFTLSRLVAALRDAGFEVRSTRTIFVLSPFAASISERLAQLVYKWEQRWLRWAGCEIIVAAERPIA